jgi:hypothetical protein
MSGVWTVPVVAAVSLLASCGSGEHLTTDAATDLSIESRDGEPIRAAAGPRPATPVQSAELEQAAVWPAADVVFGTPEQAADDLVVAMFGDPPELTLSEFRPGDSRSGEIDVLFFAEGVTSPQVTSTLLIRKLGPRDGWFVLAAVVESVTITSPESGASIPPGPVTVEGLGKGHETTIHVNAFAAGNADPPLDEAFTSGGLREPAPYSATLDLTSAPSGVTTIMAAGDSGLSRYAQPFTLIPVNIGLPGTR